MNDALRDILPIAFPMMGAVLYMLFVVIRAAVARDGPTAAGDTAVPVRATFAGVRGLPPWVALATNNASPMLVVRGAGIAYRVLNRRERSFAQIERVDVRTGWRTVNLEIAFRDSVLTFAANVGTEAAARAALALFPPDVPMTPRAAAWRAAPGAG